MALPRALVALRAGGSVPAKVAEHASEASGAGDRAEMTHTHCQRFHCRGRRPQPIARWPGADRARGRVDRARLRAQVLADEIARDVPGPSPLARSGALLTPAGVQHSLRLCCRSRRSQASTRPVGPRGAPAKRAPASAAAEEKSSGDDKKRLSASGSRGARARWEAGRDPRARALPRDRLLHPAGRSAGGRDHGRGFAIWLTLRSRVWHPLSEEPRFALKTSLAQLTQRFGRNSLEIRDRDVDSELVLSAELRDLIADEKEILLAGRPEVTPVVLQAGTASLGKSRIGSSLQALDFIRADLIADPVEKEAGFGTHCIALLTFVSNPSLSSISCSGLVGPTFPVTSLGLNSQITLSI